MFALCTEQTLLAEPFCVIADTASRIAAALEVWAQEDADARYHAQAADDEDALLALLLSTLLLRACVPQCSIEKTMFR